MAKYKCKVCGYIHEGNKAPDVCPVCAAPASDFEEMKDEAAADKKKGLDRDSNVYTVVYASASFAGTVTLMERRICCLLSFSSFFCCKFLRDC